MKLNVLSVILVSFAMILNSCGGGEKKTTQTEGNNEGSNSVVLNPNETLNISIYLDLSDRLIRQMAPSQKDKDIQIVNYMAEIVKNHAVAQKILPSNDRIKVFFYPAPNDSNIAILSENLEMDLSKAQPAEKKKILAEFQQKFERSLSQIYEATLKAKNWIGSDIWGFFKKPVETYCLKKDARNILVILTDGYIFHKDNKVKVGDDYSYILPQTLANPNSGLIVSRQDLDDLEVLMLEVNPHDPKHQDQMEEILKNWFSNMGVKHFDVGVTDQPTNTKLNIDKFM